MKKVALIYFVALLSSVMLYSCKPGDDKLQQVVQTTLATTNPGITSTVKDGVVTLTGTVDSEEAKATIETAVKGIKDIKSVTNDIKVVVPQAPVTINPDEALTTIINTAVSAAGISGVTVSITNGEVTLGGEATKENLTKVMQIANGAQPAKVINNIKIK